MPSLQALREFKASFRKLGKEPMAMAELSLPINDLELPDHEPAFIEPTEEIVEIADSGPEIPDFLADAPEEADDTGTPPPGADLLGNLGGLLGGLGLEGILGESEKAADTPEDMPDFDMAAAEGAADMPIDMPDFDMAAPDLQSGGVADDEAAADLPIDIPDFDMAAPDEAAADIPIDMPDFDMAAPDEAAADLPIDMPDFDMADEGAAELPIDMPDFGTDEAAEDLPIDMPDFDMEAGDEAAADLPIDMPDFGADDAAAELPIDMPDLGTDEAAEDLPIDMPDFGMETADLQSDGVADDEAAEDLPIDIPDFDMAAPDEAAADLPIDMPDFGADEATGDMGDFALDEGADEAAAELPIDMPDFGADDAAGDMPDFDMAAPDEAAADMPIDMPDFDMAADEAATDMPIDMPDFDMEAGDEGAADLPIDMPDFGADDAAGDMGDFALDEGADEAAADIPIDMPDFDMEAGDEGAADLPIDMPDFGADDAAADLPTDMPDFDADEAAADMPIDIPDFDMAAPDETAADMPIDMPDFDMEAGDEGAADLPIDMPDFGADDEAAADMPIDMPDFGTDEAAADMPIDMPDFDMEAGDEAAAELPIDMPDFGADEAAGDMGDFALDEGADDAAADLPIDMPDFGDDLQSGGVAADAAGDMGDFALDESADDMGGFDTDPMNLGLDDLGLANDLSAMPEAEPADMGDFSIGEGFEDSGTAASEEMDLGSDDDFGMPEDDQAFGDGAFLEDGPGDSFDNFKLDSDALAGDFELDDGNGFGDEFDGFSIASIDDARAPRAGAKAKVSKDRPDDKNEINLSTDELELLLITLADYPLNLRIACEELIAEKVVAPEKLIQLLKLLIEGTPAEETASFAGKLLGRTIKIPRGHEKKTGEELEAEQSSFAYIFIHKFLPVFRLFLMIATVILCAGYLSWQFIVIPNRAERLYRLGLERIAAGEYSRANERFNEAYRIQPKKQWFYTYARAFRDARQYALAEEKYLQLLHFTASRSRRGIPEKAAVLEYADLHTNYIGNYEMADRIIRRNILDYFPFDQEALLALGDNALAWGEFEPERLEDARIAFATVIEIYGRTDPVLERMLKYLIRSDQLEHVLPLQEHFMASARRAISSATLAELGGYLLDKRFEEVRGVPNAYLDYIMGIRDVLFRAIRQEPTLPEAYYHLARYYHFFDSYSDERYTLELAIMAFEAAREENPRRLRYNIDTHRRYAELLIGRREFFPAEENLIKAINLYQDGLRRRLLTRSPEFGRLYAELGDLEFFVKEGNLQNALDYYWLAELNEWAPPEIQYRMGAVHYQLRQWGPAQDRLIEASREMPLNRRVLHALGNVSFMRGNYFAAQGYYDRLLTILEDDRSRLPPIEPTDSAPELDLAERMMVVQNNLGVTLEALTDRTGDNRYRSRVQALYSDSARAWDILTRNPESFIRMRPAPDLFAPGINPAYLNIQNNLYPVRGFEPHFFLRIDRDALEPSQWEELAPPGFRLSEGLHSGR